MLYNFHFMILPILATILFLEPSFLTANDFSHSGVQNSLSEEVKKEEPKQEQEKQAEKKEEPKQDEKTEVKPQSTPAVPAPEAPKKYDTLSLKSSPLSINTEYDTLLWSSEYDIIEVKTKSPELSSLKIKTVLPHGHFVKKGERIISFDREDYDRNMDNARRGIETARLNFEKVKIAYELEKKQRKMADEDFELSRKLFEEQFKHAEKWEYDLEKQNYMLQMKNAAFSLENEEEELRQLEKMYRDDDLAEETEEIVLKRQRHVVAISKFNLKKAQARHEWTDKYAYPIAVRNLPREHKRSSWEMDATAEERPINRKLADINFKQAEATLKQAEKKYQEMEEDKKCFEIFAPRDGYIYYGSFFEGNWENFAKTKSMLREGQTIPTKQPLLTIVDGNKLTLHGNISEREFSKLATGQKGYFVPNTYPAEEFPVKLTEISEFPVATGTFSTKLSITHEGHQPKLYPGMKGKVTLASVRKSNALMVPETAVGRNADLQRCVYILKDGKPIQRLVKIGRIHDKKYEILDGLESGMEVIKVFSSVEQE
ncbi:MAG: HlyD family efflux transporter periplasmic adaptor subunit [Planctomycetia bacterium]|nr:HlyD family efflux transporter periplasmic adaptor subunit [Planctomycetia bacterium]